MLCAFARLKAEGYDEMLAAAEKLMPLLTGMNPWGLCALTWSAAGQR